MKRVLPLVLPVLLLGFLPGCLLRRAVVDQPIDPAAVAALVPGESTAGDVVAQLGAPSEIVQLGHRSAYGYRHAVAKTTGLWLLVFATYNEDTRSDRVWVFFDEQNVLTHLGATLAAERADWRMPWSDVED